MSEREGGGESMALFHQQVRECDCCTSPATSNTSLSTSPIELLRERPGLAWFDLHEPD